MSIYPNLLEIKVEPRAIKCIFVGYGFNQKGYHCFDPTQNKLYTTMDCDFFENSYLYSQPRPQGGDFLCDDLSWLTQSVTNDLNPKDQVGNPVDIATEDIVLLPPQASPTLSEASSEQEAVCEPQAVVLLNLILKLMMMNYLREAKEAFLQSSMIQSLSHKDFDILLAVIRIIWHRRQWHF